MVDVHYTNHNGETFILNGDGLTFVDDMPLHEYEWDYTLTNRVTGMGGMAGNFARWPREFSFEIRMRGFARQQFLAQANRLHAVADADCVAETPGRLYVDGQYMTCFLAVGGGVPSHPKTGNFATREVTVLAVEPYWCTEVTTIINPAADTTDTTGKKYNYNYAYRYGTGLSAGSIYNEHYAPAPAIITVFGPASNPSIIIGGNTYAVDVVLTATDYLVIDQTTHQIYIVTENGARTDVFNSRDKVHDIFTPIAVGESAVVYGGEYAIQITLVQQRSELLWTE